MDQEKGERDAVTRKDTRRSSTATINEDNMRTPLYNSLNHHRQRTATTAATSAATPEETQEPAAAVPKSTLFQKLRHTLQPPPLPQCRKAVKMAIAMVIALVMVLDNRTRESLGNDAALLVPIIMTLYFPSRSVGKFFYNPPLMSPPRCARVS